MCFKKKKGKASPNSFSLVKNGISDKMIFFKNPKQTLMTKVIFFYKKIIFSEKI